MNSNPIRPILSTGKPGIRPEKRFVFESDSAGTIGFQTWERPAIRRWFHARCMQQDYCAVVDALTRKTLAECVRTPNGFRRTVGDL